MKRFPRSPRFNAALWLSGALALSLAALPGVSAAANPLEDVEWRLVELAGTAVPLRTDERQPFLKLDPAKKQANGYGGCNNFFGGYELDGAMITFGPLASTRRACGGPRDAIEMKFLKALGAARSWRITSGRLLLLDDDTALARFERAVSGMTTP